MFVPVIDGCSELTTPRFPAFPAMIQPIFDARGIEGCHITYLNRDRTDNLRDKNGKSVRLEQGNCT
jgi:hypothetical protein